MAIGHDESPSTASGPGGRGAARDTKQLIVEAALVRFAEAGYDGTSLNDIAADVGIRRPSLLHHFASKDALYQEVFEYLFADWADRLSNAINDSRAGWPKVRLVLRAGFRFFAERPSYVRLVRREAISGGAHLVVDLAGVLRPMFDRAVAYFEREMESGTMVRQDARQLVVTGYGALLSYFSDADLFAQLLGVDPLAPEALAEREHHVIEFFRTALVPTSAPEPPHRS